MKKRYFIVLAMLFTLLLAEGEPTAGSGGGDTGTETVKPKSKEKTDKEKNQDVKDSINKAVKEVQNENTGKPAATDTQVTDPGTDVPNTNGTTGVNGTGNGETPAVPGDGTQPATVEQPAVKVKPAAVKIDPKKPVKKAIDKEQEGPTFYKGEILKYIATTDGYVIKTNGSDVVHPIASITKVMNILVALDQVDKGNKSLDDKVCFDQATANVGGSWLNVKAGECFTLKDLLRAENIYSANNAAYLVAKHVGNGSIDKFVELMNEKAKELGMKNTKFNTPAGLPTSMTGRALDTSTADDLYLLAMAAIKDTRIREWASEKELILENSLGEQIVYPSRNHLLEKYGIWGLKTGFHNLSGYNIITTSKRGNVEIIAVVLGEVTDPARTKLLTEEFAEIEKQLTVVKKAGTDMGGFKLKDGKKKEINGVLAEDVYEIKNNPYEYETRDLNIKAPVQKGTVIGELVIKKGGKEISKVNIISNEEVKELSGFGKFLRFITFGWL
ncbi:D-alanyl-D-alanine carboxypeptidase family protein [Sebaldella sp. S0638]|uniref:D-alanyl-D-alanine carboxypeptidase family protein n=1 Tax=Sebaldella sp. S0638 TaxID=2957809 RepID=UPI0020A1735D|nr:D-alanyl-D-alanine carboxypeptidase family protein [Sebaldella sp. S0638]MCP1224164.1 D-alanyl-D-alanine carboxypeptidase [Sebaldella sp. S0638]